jgi:acetyl/propionyl-CoA carboxylase alpha subunit
MSHHVRPDRNHPNILLSISIQNVLRAPKAATVKTVKVVPGSHLKVDQVIIEFE